MQEENNSETTVTVISPEPPVENAEAVTEAIEEVAEAQANSDVEIAEIRAAETIATATIAADVERDRIAAQERATTTVANNEDEKWQEITNLRGQVQNLSETVNKLLQSQTDQSTLPQSEAETVEILTPQSTLEETNTTLTEAIQENVGERPGVEAEALVRRVRRAI